MSGFKISGGRLNDKTLYLEDELSREFANSLPTFMAKVRKRENNNHYMVRMDRARLY